MLLTLLLLLVAQLMMMRMLRLSQLWLIMLLLLLLVQRENIFAISVRRCHCAALMSLISATRPS